MRKNEFELRPKAEMVLNAWYSIRGKLNEDVIEDQPLRFREGVKPRYTTTPSPTSSTYRLRGRGASVSHSGPENASSSRLNGHPGPNSRPWIGGYPEAASYPTSASYSDLSGHSSTSSRSVSNEQPSANAYPSTISSRSHLPAAQPVAGPSGCPRV
jgi:hypothetical protein